MKKSLIENLFLTGCVIKTRIKIWPGKKKLNPEFIGIDSNRFNENLVSLGNMYLLPKEEIDKLIRFRTQANTLITANSLNFDFGSFVANSKVENLKSQLESIKVLFNEAVEDLKNRFPMLSQRMKQSWNAELVSIAAANGDSDLVFNVMNKIENCFQSWSEIESKFDFDFSEYHDINDIAKEFIYESTKGIIEKMGEFAAKLKLRIERQNLSERNLKPVRAFLDSLRSSMEVFQNDKLNSMLDSMEEWTMEGTSDDLTSASTSKAMSKAMEGLIDLADNQIDEIAKTSVESMTNFKRKIKT